MATAVHGATSDAHTGSAALMAAAVERAPAAGHDTAAAVSGLLEQPDIWAKQQLTKESGRCDELNWTHQTSK
ncbi:hypothetical protein MRB53_032834 [Persea americana]|uniref:Uncharacterized protein n=1 Tax=Persea americana TaxID=3435 RepID=A0ACC2KT02_PERAE|nr:hypothetical protein MRB53_032834 [Persea americana]